MKPFSFYLRCGFSLLIIILTLSCSTLKETSPLKGTIETPSPIITDKGIKTSQQLTNFFIANNPQKPKDKIERLSNFYITEAAIEGINSDVAFVQMCLETGFLQFGGLVIESMNNFCGLGAINEQKRGEIFKTEQLGVRAHIQHLKAYGSREALKGTLIDPRYKWVTPKGKAYDIFGLSKTWAQDPQYGEKLFFLLQKLSHY